MALLTYRKISKTDLQIIFICILSTFFVGFMFISQGVLEPFRLMGGVLGVILLPFFSKERILFSSIFASFLFAYFLRILSHFVLAPFVYLFGVQNETLFWSLFLLTEIGVYCLIFSRFKFKDGIPALEENEARKTVFIISALILLLYGGIHNITDFVSEDPENPLFDVIFIILGFIFFIVVAALIHLIRYLIIKHRQMLEARRREAQLKTKQKELSKMIQGLIREGHKHRDVVPSFVAAHEAMAEQLQKLIGGNKNVGLKQLESYVEVVKNFSSEMSEELVDMEIGSEISALKLPSAWIGFERRLEEIGRKARAAGVYLTIWNQAGNWDDLKVEMIDFIRLVGNLVNNAIRESTKVSVGSRQVNLDFLRDEDGYFIVSVRDFAKPFEVDVLKHLGEKGNSTNESGYGYFEVFEILAKTGASFFMEEKQLSENYAKTISICFNGSRFRVIYSDYRAGELEIALEDAGFEVV